MSVTTEHVWKALESVFDPEVGMSIVALGLVYNVETHDDAVRVTMTLTTPGCPIHDSMAGWVREAIMQLPGVLDVEVKLTFDPPWSPERIKPPPARDPLAR